MRPVRAVVMGVLALAATALVPGAAQASTASYGAETPALAAASGHLVHLRGGRTVYLRQSTLPPASGPLGHASLTAAGAQPAASTYVQGYAEICNDSACSKWYVEIDYAETYNGNNVWINGWPECYQEGTDIAHCGYDDNGQRYMDVYVNFGPSYKYLFDIELGADGWCGYEYSLGALGYNDCAL